MSNATKKQDERDSLKEFFKRCSHPLAKKLLSFSDRSEENQERPDIILADGNSAYGIEHIHLPFCLEGPGDADIVQRFREGETFRKFIVDEKKGINKLAGHEEEARSGIESIVNHRLRALSEMTYEKYITSCRALLEKHNAPMYSENIRKRFPQKECHIVFLLDITRPSMVKELRYWHKVGQKSQQGVRLDYPFTYDFLNLLKEYSDVDFFFLIWHPDRSYGKKETRSYVLDPKENWKNQRLPAIWERFEFPEAWFHPWTVKLVGECEPEFPID